MARKSAVVTISREGRDKGKTFVITEMSAMRAEKWATRAFLALGRAGVEVPDGLADAGIAGLAVLGLRALASLRFEDAEPLLDEMFARVQIMPDPRNPETVRSVMEDEVEEVSTILKLRAEALDLHMGFSFAGDVFALISDMISSPASPSTGTSPGA